MCHAGKEKSIGLLLRRNLRSRSHAGGMGKRPSAIQVVDLAGDHLRGVDGAAPLFEAGEIPLPGGHEILQDQTQIGIRFFGCPCPVEFKEPLFGLKQFFYNCMHVHIPSDQSFFQFSGRKARTAAPAFHISDPRHSSSSFSSFSR